MTSHTTTRVAVALFLPAALALMPVAASTGNGGNVGQKTATMEPGSTSTLSRSGEQIARQVVSSGGGPGVSSNFRLDGTVGQCAVGFGSSPNFGLSHGYWVMTGGSSCCVYRGDIDHGGTATPDITDLVYLVSFMFQGGAEPPCMEEADVDGSGSGPDIADLVYLVSYMFQGGPEPVPCP